MSGFNSKDRPAPEHVALSRGSRLLAAVAVVAMTSGCAAVKRDHVVVGSVPQDYRTNHPITIAEREIALDMPADSGGMTKGEEETLAGFLGRYNRESGNVVRLMVPSGSANEAAAVRKATALAAALTRHGINRAAIQTVPYGVADASAIAPVRVAYMALTADTDRCGRWPGDLAETSENRNYANFGCSYQKNLAAQIANPTDLVGPRASSEIDPGRRGTVIDEWQTGQLPWTRTILY